MRNERIRRDSHQNVLRKTPRSVTKSEQCRVSLPHFPWSTHETPGTMTPLLATKTLAFYDSGFLTEARVINVTNILFIGFVEFETKQWFLTLG